MNAKNTSKIVVFVENEKPIIDPDPEYNPNKLRTSTPNIADSIKKLSDPSVREGYVTNEFHQRNRLYSMKKYQRRNFALTNAPSARFD